MNTQRKRIRHANKYLQFYLQENDHFYVGLLFEDFIKNQNLIKYNLLKTFINENKIMPKGIGSVTKVNIKGKYERKQPEEKVTKKVHIEYTRRDGAFISYDRNFDVFVKVLKHKYNVELIYKINKHGQQVVVSDMLHFDETTENIQKNTHIINIYCEIFNDFEIFNSELEPAIHFNKKFEKDILPKGSLQDDTVFEEIKEFAGRYTRNTETQKAFQKRLHVLKRYDPDVRGKGPSNFYGYIVFGFSSLKIVVLETMYSGNATYIFNEKDYEEKIIQDKQTVLNTKAMLKRFYHHDNWEHKIIAYIESLKKKVDESVVVLTSV